MPDISTQLTPTLLTDLTRLPEIYALRVACWEQSPGAQYINSQLFPDGWTDALDTHPTARHWVVEDGGRIVAAARVVALDLVEQCDQPDFLHFVLPNGRPFGYLSRLVILPAYRRQGLAEVFDQLRLAWLRETGAAFGLCSPIPKRLAPLLRLGWTHLGDIMYQSGGQSPQQLPEPLCLWLPAGSLPSAGSTT